MAKDTSTCHGADDITFLLKINKSKLIDTGFKKQFLQKKIKILSKSHSADTESQKLPFNG